MVVVKIELWPSGDESQAKEIGRMEISNNETGNTQTGRYDAKLLHAGVYFGRPGHWKSARNIEYRRSLSPYHLVAKVLKACGIY